MEKNWYLLYTRPGREKKVTALLTKRKVINFPALNHKETEAAKGRKMTYVPLFTSYGLLRLLQLNWKS
jgi:transcription antitermination factor NusG